nr:aurora kinase A-interacting protein isoform X3 [Manis javanica]
MRSPCPGLLRAPAGRPPSRHLHAHLCSSSPEHLAPPRRPQAMFLARLTSQLLRVVPRAGCSRLGPVSEVLGSHACRPCCSTQPTGPSGVASLPGRGIQLELEQMLVPRKMSISPLESWLTARYLLPRLDAGASAQLYKCPPSQFLPSFKRRPLPFYQWDLHPVPQARGICSPFSLLSPPI